MFGRSEEVDVPVRKQPHRPAAALTTFSHYFINEVTVPDDLQVLHPSLSRQHAVVLHMMVGKEGEAKKPGIVVMDLGSNAHTFINSKKIKPKIQVIVPLN